VQKKEWPANEDILSLTLEEKEDKEYFKSIFETLILVAEQIISLDGYESHEILEDFKDYSCYFSSTKEALESGEEVLRNILRPQYQHIFLF
jgi:hypothetical protein